MSMTRKIVRNYYRYLFTQGVHGKPNKCLHRHWEIQRFNKRHQSSNEVAEPLVVPTPTNSTGGV